MAQFLVQHTSQSNCFKRYHKAWLLYRTFTVLLAASSGQNKLFRSRYADSFSRIAWNIPPSWENERILLSSSWSLQWHYENYLTLPLWSAWKSVFPLHLQGNSQKLSAIKYMCSESLLLHLTKRKSKTQSFTVISLNICNYFMYNIWRCSPPRYKTVYHLLHRPLLQQFFLIVKVELSVLPFQIPVAPQSHAASLLWTLFLWFSI